MSGSDIDTKTTKAEATKSSTLTRKQKRWRKRLPWSDTVTEAFPTYAEVMDRAVRTAQHRYSKFGWWHMAWFRIGGILEIVLSVSFPFVYTALRSADGGWQDTVITGISVAIAVVGGIRGFYGWNENWHLYKTQELALTGIIQRWELELMALAAQPKENVSKTHKATKHALEQVAIALEHEQDAFFGSVRLPDELIQRNGSPRAGVPSSPQE
ncbi:DUF4231 domain-containing protein [Kibdelosporangium aridum]|uniref:DUF4231 domain-containing protein n=1 Tax=Kibdelosporangium aridum TaxID=2030 RepID=A0A1Y5XJ52_KIBAR|nr:SLATT domain-containing protein [Kibdelosporangium aridum]SMC98119.1 Protein of unknown function [Kibdelosporangium aridum]